jgi:inosine-uridine nucleoside N-ribohydrolase
VNVLVDCDPGIDDALALCVLIAHDRAALQAVTTVFGNVPVRQATRNAVRLLHAVAPSRPVQLAEGSEHPLIGSRLPRRALHGHDGLGGLEIPIVPVPRALPQSTPLMTQLAAAGAIDTVVALGPLTNVAHAFASAPKALRTLRSVAAVAGVLTEPGDAATEFNLASDPAAARCVLGGQLSLRWVPVGISGRPLLEAEALDAFERRHRTGAGRTIAALVRYLLRHRGDGQRAACPDAVGMALALDPSLGRWRQRRLALEGRARTGRVCVEPGVPNVQLCEAIDETAVAASLWTAWGRAAGAATG